MTKNSKGGNKNRRRGRKFSKPQSRELILKQSGQEYGRLEKNLGNHHFECLCADGIVRRANIPGSFQKRYWMRVKAFWKKSSIESHTPSLTNSTLNGSRI